MEAGARDFEARIDFEDLVNCSFCNSAMALIIQIRKGGHASASGSSTFSWLSTLIGVSSTSSPPDEFFGFNFFFLRFVFLADPELVAAVL